jgi:hypothetical protein
LYEEFIFKIDRDIEKNKRYNRKFYQKITEKFYDQGLDFYKQ